MVAVIDLVGRSFDRLTVIAKAPSGKNGMSRWRCECSCGTEVEAFSVNLRRGHTRSCGCSQNELLTQRATHRMSKTSPYYRWASMIQRCTNPQHDAYDRYGGRGIGICERWLASFENFYADMGNPVPGKTLDRKDNDGDYSPENCRWATDTEQANNRRPRSCFRKETRC